MNKKIRFFAIMALVLLLSMSTTVSAVDWQISKSKTATPTMLDSSNTQTDISLQLPAASWQRTIDIVLVMDKSTSGQAKISQFISNSKNLVDQLHTKAENDENIDIRVAVVKYRGNAFDMVNVITNGAQSGLVSIKTSEGVTTVKSALDETTYFNYANGEDRGTGSNIHSGIQFANNLLSADTATAAGDKYMLLYTDGLGYLWNDENGVPQTIYTQVVQTGNLSGLGYGSGSNFNQGLNGTPNADQRVAKDKYYATGSAYIPNGVTPLRFGTAFDSANVYTNALAMFNAMMATNNAEFTGTSPYERDVIFNGHAFSIANELVVNPSDSAYTVTAHPIQNLATDFSPQQAGLTSFNTYYEVNDTYCDTTTPYLESNPYEVVEVNGDYYYANVDNGNGTYSYDPSVPSDTSHFIVNSDYFMIHATSIEKGTYMAAKEFDEMVDAGYHCATFYYDNLPNNQEYYLGTGLRQYLASRSDYASNSTSSTDMTAAFTDMRTDMNYLIAEGTVTDPIPADFELVMDKYNNMPFQVTVSGTPQTATYDGSKWTFGTADAQTGNYPYEVSYNSSTRVITFDINTPVDTSAPVVLNYSLNLINGVNGRTYPTNGTTTLSYTDSVGNTGTENFEIPSVTYGDATPQSAWRSFLVYDFDVTNQAGEHMLLLLSGADNASESVGFTYTVSGSEAVTQAADMQNLAVYNAYSPAGAKVHVKAKDTGKATLYACTIWVSDAVYNNPSTTITFHPYMTTGGTTSQGPAYTWTKGGNVLTLAQ